MIQKHKRIITLITATILFALLSSSCSTLKGLGRDIRKVGRSVKNIVTQVLKSLDEVAEFFRDIR